MKIYLAGPWVRRPEVREIAKQLEAAGHTITSRWLYEHHGDPNDSAGLTSSDAYIRLQANEDIADVKNSDAFVILNLEKSEGKAVELGVALALRIPVYSVGPRFNIFCTLGTECPNVDGLIFALSPFATPA